MHIQRVQISNFRNFASLDVALCRDIVIVGENRTGKSNFIHALRLVLDAALPDSSRQLKFSDIWDGCDIKTSPVVSVHVDIADFDTDPNLTSILTDYRLASDHRLARLSYVFQKKSDVETEPKSEIDYEFHVFGGGDETRSVRPETRRRIAFNVLSALRDAEAELAAWRTSPLRPLLEDAVSNVSQVDLETLTGDLNGVSAKLANLPPINALEASLRKDIADLVGASQDIKAKFGFAPSDPLRLFRAIALFIDEGKRSLSEASTGSANLALLALRLAEFAWRGKRNERNYTILGVEEPEAHLHPHLQRQIFNKLFSESDALRSLILTTHSPNVVSVAPLSSIVLLRSAGGTSGYSLAALNFTEAERLDLSRYLNATRAELLFSRGVIFVEGDSEVALLATFAKSIGADLDELGISVCNVGGVNFRPYVRLAAGLGLPFTVITDWDPVDPAKPLGRRRLLDLMEDIRSVQGKPALSQGDLDTLAADDATLKEAAMDYGLFTNGITFETEIAMTEGLIDALLLTLEEEAFGAARRKRLAKWKNDPKTVEIEPLLRMISDVGKGRIAGRLALRAVNLPAPKYIEAAIRSLSSRV